jgi:hypothetical protein
MDRTRGGGYSALIEAAYDLIPAGMHPLIRPHFLTGVDPVFVGLHRYGTTTDGRPYSGTAHVAYRYHQQHLPADRRHVTVVLPQIYDLRTVVHELGHVLHERLSFEPKPVPVTAYAGTNWLESFAESFAAWVLPFGHGYGDAKDRLYERDRATVALFDGLAS